MSETLQQGIYKSNLESRSSQKLIMQFCNQCKATELRIFLLKNQKQSPSYDFDTSKSMFLILDKERRLNRLLHITSCNCMMQSKNTVSQRLSSFLMRKLDTETVKLTFILPQVLSFLRKEVCFSKKKSTNVAEHFGVSLI